MGRRARGPRDSEWGRLEGPPLARSFVEVRGENKEISLLLPSPVAFQSRALPSSAFATHARLPFAQLSFSPIRITSLRPRFHTLILGLSRRGAVSIPFSRGVTFEDKIAAVAGWASKRGRGPGPGGRARG